jgi:hypothetical protein
MEGIRSLQQGKLGDKNWRNKSAATQKVTKKGKKLPKSNTQDNQENIPEKFFNMHNNFEALNGLDFHDERYDQKNMTSKLHYVDLDF